MKTSTMAAWIFLLFTLGITSCGGTETVVSSNSANSTSDNTEQADENTDPIRLFDGPTDPGDDTGH